MSKTFATILAEMIEKSMYTTTVADINAGSVMSSMLEQLRTPHERLVKFLFKLDPVRFRFTSSITWKDHAADQYKPSTLKCPN